MTRVMRITIAAIAAVLVVATAVVGVLEVRGRAWPRALGPVDAKASIDFSLVLARRHVDALARVASDPDGHLTAEQLGARFGLRDEDLTKVLDAARASGFDVVATYPQRTAIRLRGSAAEIDRAFDTQLAEFEQPSGRLYRAPVTPPVVPPELRPFVTAVAGLDTAAIPAFSAAAPSLSRLFDIPPDGLTPAEAATAYGVTPLHDAGFTGQGQTIALFSGATFAQSDVDRFDELFGVDAAPPIERIPVNGGTTDSTSEIAGEVALDIDVVRGLAPDAQILNYEVDLASSADISSFPQAIADVVDRIVADGRVDIISISYGITDTPDHCGLSWLTPEDRLRGEQALQAAAAAGIAVFVSSGDQGAYASQHFDPSCVRKTVTWPGSSPWVTSVGGTLLSVADDGSYLGESGWEDVLWHWGTGGGTNPVDARPDWQVAPGVDNGFSDGKREVPDVAATADPDSGPITVFDGQVSRSGGTSASAPFWAASWLLIGQYLEANGSSLPGFANPTLYTLASTPQPFAPYHDVLRGGNRLRDCTPGWDYATGLGSPDVWNIARDLLAGVRSG